jgi:hypothetical protein
MDFRSETRAVGYGLLAAASAFGGLLAAGLGTSLVFGSGYAPAFLSSAAWLVFMFAFAPAIAVYLVIKVIARLLGSEERALGAAAGAGLGGTIALAGSFVVNGLFLFVGWFLFPWTFAYAAMVLPGLLRRSSLQGARAIALHVGVATGVYTPWIALTLYNAFDRSAEMAGFREGAGWMENFPSAIVLSVLYAMVIIAAVGAIRSPDVGPDSGQSALSDRTPIR